MPVERVQIKQLEKIAQKALLFAQKRTPAGKALVFGLYGNLGAGKTTFTQALSRIVVAQKPVKSPTFILMRKSPIKWKTYTTLVHIDAYRFENEKDANPLALTQEFENPNNIIVIEWADIIEGVLPAHTNKISFEVVDENTRAITW
jgi:tRNA threonylcarbamoyladenosine biosynthesis protein TsaE